MCPLRDLPDVLLLRDLVQPEGQAAVNAACVEIFELRGRHPPRIESPEHWPEPYRAMAESMSFPILDVHEAAEAVKAIVDVLASA